MNVSIIGTGYVGLVTGVAMAASGHSVVCIGRNHGKTDSINLGKAPFFEPGLDALLNRVVTKKKLTASVDFAGSILASDLTIIAVGTPTEGGAINLTQVNEAVRMLGIALSHKSSYHVVVVKSTVTPGTSEGVVWPILTQASGKSEHEIGLCMSPEFLREGNALEDALDPDRIVIGSRDKKSARLYAQLFAKNSCPKYFTNLTTAEMSKYVSNVVLATLVSFANEIGALASQTPGVDVTSIWQMIHADRRWHVRVGNKRIAPGIVQYLFTGCGYGGSCFPKDTKALYHFASQQGIPMPMLGATIAINDRQPNQLVSVIEKTVGDLRGKKIAVLGLTFKPDTDDIRESIGVAVVRELATRGANVAAHDPQAYSVQIPERLNIPGVILAKHYEDAIANSDAVIITTAWNSYKKIAPEVFIKRMKNPIIIDGRRIYDPSTYGKAGVRYVAVGRGLGL